jgi:pyruvate formate lyase activating enzyme
MATPAPLRSLLRRLTRPAELVEARPNGRVLCYACGHRCLVPPGREGVCRVRFNEDGVLRAPWGYVGALQLDPVEKKPFFHALPGARALSFGMLGCDYHCGYCFVPGTEVRTVAGSRPIDLLFSRAETVFETEKDAVGVLPGVDVVTHRGRARPVRGVFRRRYSGPLVEIEMQRAEVLRTTPDHEFLVRARAARGAAPTFFVPASAITPEFDLLEPVSDGGYRRRVIADTRLVRYDGPVYNLEVEEDQTYLVHDLAVHNCQNWITSQALRDPAAVAPPEDVTPEDLVGMARRSGARIVTSTYNEPLITSEWAVAVFREAKAAGLVCSYVSNGNATPEVLDYIQPWVSLYKVDLKGFRDRAYRDLGGTLERVTATIRDLHARGIWLEVVTLIVPGLNDSDAELSDIAGFLASVSRDVPWHVTAFHPDYKMTEPFRTSADTLRRAAELGRAAGLHFVYAGNLPGAVGEWEDTRCPGCQATLVERRGFRVLQNRIGRDGRCPGCGRAIPGFWAAPAAT